MSYVDQPLLCRDCGVEFMFAAAEQEFYAQKGLVNQPQRCPACRANRRRQRRGLAPRQMYSVICGACGAPTMVPFQPSSFRPVYCSSCFARTRATQATSAVSSGS